MRWSEAMAAALYGTDQPALYGTGGFWRGNAPADHFRTSVHVSWQFADALARLAVEVDAELGQPSVFHIVDIGAGSGELLSQLLYSLPATLADRTRLIAVELRPRPSSLDPRITWVASPPRGITGLVVANEWLDNVPVDVVARGIEGELTYILVDPKTGRQQPGPPASADDAAWIDRWWPIAADEREWVAEVGRQRDRAWADAISGIDAGMALAIDYSHDLHERAAGRFAAGTLTGFRNGRAVPPVPDGSCDLSAHVALDACLAAGENAGAEAAVLTCQRLALQALGVDGSRPPIDLASTEPATYLHALSQASTAAELLDTQGLGNFGWLLQTKGTKAPPSLRSLTVASTQ